MTIRARRDQAVFQQTSRRGFLKRSSPSISGTAPSAAVATHAHAQGDETIKVALVGCGGRGMGAVTQALSTKGPVKLWAIADAFADRIEAGYNALVKGQEARYDREAHQGFAAGIDVPPERRFTGFDGYQQAIQSGVDVVILTAPPHFRPMHFEYAVQQGKHVFMEKPVAVDAPGVRRILAAGEEAQKKNLKVGVGLQRRHQPLYQETIKRLHDGVLGDLLLLRCYWNSGYIWFIRRKPGITEMEYQLRNWPYFTWLSGDHNVEQHIHNIDVCDWVLRGHPLSAQGQGGRQVRPGPEQGHIFDHHTVEYTYEGGIKMFAQCRQIPGCWNLTAEFAHGTKGSCQLDRGQIEAAEKWRFRGQSPNPYQVEHDVLFDAIRNNKPHNEAQTGAHSTMTAILGRMATYSGKMVQWDEAINSQLSLAPQQYAMDAQPPVVPDANGRYPDAKPGLTRAF